MHLLLLESADDGLDGHEFLLVLLDPVRSAGSCPEINLFDQVSLLTPELRQEVGGGNVIVAGEARDLDERALHLQRLEAIARLNPSRVKVKARGFKAILRRSVTVRVVEDVDDVVLSAAEAKALVAGDPDVLRRLQLQTEIVKMEALRAAHLDQHIQARWELKRLPQRIADLRARVEAIAADVAFRDIHTPQPNAQGDRLFSFVVDRRIYTDRVEAAPALAAALERGTETCFTAGQATGSSPSTPIAAYRGFQVTVRPAGSGTIRLGLRCPDRSDALEYATARTLDVAQVPAYGIGLFQRLDNLLDALGAELRAAQDGLAREETNLASYSDQLARPFDREEALRSAQRDLARIDRKLTHHGGLSGPPTPPHINTALDDEAAA